MRDIGSNRITGPQAIVVAAVAWWVKARGGIRGEVLESFGAADAHSVATRAPIQLGEAVLSVPPADALLGEFFRAAGENEVMRYMVGQAALAWRGVPDGDRVRAVRAYALRVLAEEAGSLVKSSGALGSRSAEISAVRRRVRKGRGPA